MSERYQEIRSKGATVAAIGMGTPEHAAHFRDTRDIPFTLLVDRTKQTYRALDLKRGTWMEILGPKNWPRFVRNTLTGKMNARPQQDAMQLGGTVVADAGGKILYVHRSERPSDNAQLDEIVAALPQP